MVKNWQRFVLPLCWMAAMAVAARIYFEIKAFLWHFLIYEHRVGNLAAVSFVECLWKQRNERKKTTISLCGKLTRGANVSCVQPPTRATVMSPRNKALMLFSI